MDFNDIKIVIKYTYENFEYYLLDISELDIENARKKSKDDGEEALYQVWRLMVCNEDGVLFNHTKQQIKKIPLSLRLDMAKSISEMITGQKKS